MKNISLMAVTLIGIMACQKDGQDPSQLTQVQTKPDDSGVPSQNPSAPLIPSSQETKIYAVGFKSIPPVSNSETERPDQEAVASAKQEAFAQGVKALESALSRTLVSVENLPAIYGNAGVKIALTPGEAEIVKQLNEVQWVTEPLPENSQPPGIGFPVEGSSESEKKVSTHPVEGSGP